MAPKGEKEEVRVVRPLKFIAFLCALLAMVALATSVATSYWLENAGGRVRFHQGLWWQYCETDPSTNQELWTATTDRAWLPVCGVLCVVSLLVCLLASLLALLALLIKRPAAKRRLYIAAAFTLLLAGVCILAPLAVFPVMVMQQIEEYQIKYKVADYLFSWSYGLGWGAWLFMVGGGVLLLIGQRSEKGDGREGFGGGAGGKAAYYDAGS